MIISRWAEELDMFQYYAENLAVLKKAATEDLTIPDVLAQKLFDKKFHEQITKLAENLNFVKVVAMNLSNLSDTMGAWLNMYQNTGLITEGSDLQEKIFSKFNLTAYVLNPKYKDLLLNSKQKSVVRFFVSKLLRNPVEYENFDEYLDGRGEYGQEELQSMDVKGFWTIMKGYSEKLSNLGLLFNSLPATTLSRFEEDVESKAQPLDPFAKRKINFIKSTC